MEEGDEDLAVPTRPSHQACPEDDDFLAALDKMVNENIAESKNAGEIKSLIKHILKLLKLVLSSRQERDVFHDWSCERSQGEEELGAAPAGE